MDIGIIRAARRWMQRLLDSRMPPPEPVTAAALEKALGIRVQSLQLWRANWRNRIYRVECAPGLVWIAKQHGASTSAEFRREYEQLGALTQLPVDGLCMPEPVASLPERFTYVMELARGRSIKDLMAEQDEDSQAREACKRAGQVLAQVHERWTTNVGRFPATAFAEDLAEIPGGLSARQWRILESALARLAPERVALGKLFLDFKASNVFYERGRIALIDPPEEDRQGLLLWDVATFVRYLGWQMLKRALARPLGTRRRQRILEGAAIFQSSYAAHYSPLGIETPALSLIVLLLQLQQAGQLLALQLGKLRLLRRRKELFAWNGQYAAELTRALASLPLLAMRKRRLIRRIANETLEPYVGRWPTGTEDREPARPLWTA
jgi:Ser/Thr protein kinase RdoA (MazF antagonist)